MTFREPVRGAERSAVSPECSKFTNPNTSRSSSRKARLSVAKSTLFGE